MKIRWDELNGTFLGVMFTWIIGKLIIPDMGWLEILRVVLMAQLGVFPSVFFLGERLIKRTEKTCKTTSK